MQGRADVEGMSDPRRAFGAAGERAAERVLEARGMRVVARNARTRFGEIDLVLRETAGYVFVEVKTRRASSFVSAAEAVDRRKARRIAALAEAWLAHHGERGAAWRIAVIALTISPSGSTAEVIDLD